MHIGGAGAAQGDLGVFMMATVIGLPVVAIAIGDMLIARGLQTAAPSGNGFPGYRAFLSVGWFSALAPVVSILWLLAR